MTGFFRAYDLRGKYPNEIGEEQAQRIGQAVGTFVDGSEILVGRDGRTHADTIKDAFVRGVTATGTDVRDVGSVPTPIVRFASWNSDIGTAVMITASHNPPEYTGFKFSTQNGMAMTREGGMAEIQEIYERGSFTDGEGTVTKTDIRPVYLEYLISKLETNLGLSVVVNFANGISAKVGRDLLERLGCDVHGINENINGEFPDHPPTPNNETAIRRVVDKLGTADLGIIFDGDGDRAGFVLPDTGKVSPDGVLALFGRECLRETTGTVIYSLDASQLVAETVRKHGGTPEEVRVGFSFISEKIHRNPDIVFAGEPSGHYAFPVFGIPWDDGLFAAGFMCQLVANQDVPAILREFPEYPVSPQLRLDCPDEQKHDVIKGVSSAFAEYEQSTIDGVKIFFDDGWALIRPSNTEPKVSIRCEADTKSALNRIQREITEAVTRQIDTEC